MVKETCHNLLDADLEHTMKWLSFEQARDALGIRPIASLPDGAQMRRSTCNHLKVIFALLSFLLMVSLHTYSKKPLVLIHNDFVAPGLSHSWMRRPSSPEGLLLLQTVCPIMVYGGLEGLVK